MVDADGSGDALVELEDVEELEPEEGAPEVPPVDLGYLGDYVSGIRVKATPEEKDAVQVFSRRLVEDYEYPKSNLQTRPQFKVRKHPSAP